MTEYFRKKRQEEVVQQEQDNLWWLTPAAAGLGAIALGSYIYKGIGKQGGNVMADMLHFLGRPRGEAVNVNLIANTGGMAPASGASGIRSYLSGTFNVGRQKVQLGPIDIIRDIGSSLEIIGDTRGAVRDKIASRVTEAINRRYAHTTQTSFFSNNLQRITFDEVVNNEGTWRGLLGENQWKTMKAGLNSGLVSGNQFLDKNIYKTNRGFLRDTRLRNLFTSIDSEGNLASKFDIFGQARVFKSLRGNQQLAARLPPSQSVSGPSFYIDGKVYAYTKDNGAITEHLMGINRVLRETGDALEPIRAAKEGRIKYNIKPRTGFFGSLISRFEELTGVGTSFKNRYSDYQRWITLPLKRAKDIATGKAVVREKLINKSDKYLGFIDEALGADYPEIVQAHKKTETIIGREVKFNDLSVMQKLLTVKGLSTKYEVLRAGTGHYYDTILNMGLKPTLRESDRLIPRPPTGGIEILDGVASHLPRHPSEGVKEISKYYTAPASRLIPGVSSTRDLASYMFYRVSHLASSSLLGVSFAPAPTLLGNMTRLAAIPLIYEAGRQSLMYADYAAESMTGISPIKTLATVYTKARELQQEAREAIGLQQTFESMENNFPGSVNSGLGFLLRSAAAPLGAFGLLSKFGIGKAAIGAGAVFGLIGGVSPDQSSEALRKEYSGEIKVPIRKGRWWSGGYAPWEGNDIERFDYSWYHKLTNNPRTKSIYGSEDEYWKYHANVFGIPLPTPSNLFGLRNVLNPYRLEQINWQTRPYEQTSPALSEIPIFGPVLGETIGRLMKPTIYREPSMDLYRAGVVPGGLTAQSARDLGMTALEVSDIKTDNMLDRIYKMANVAAEPMGVYKFVMEYFGLKLEPTNQQVATSLNIDALGKQLYAANVGGALGQSELIRRYMLSDYYSPTNVASMVNRIPNNAPNWLPGSGSIFKRDQAYSSDFQRGNPFDKIANAEYRLPGPGYESVNELESGKSGVYSDVDKFLILSDVAPYSQAYGHYEKIVSNMALDEKWKNKVELAKEYRNKMISLDNRYPRYIDDINAVNKHIQDSSLYKSARGAYDFITHDILAEIPLLGSKLAPFRTTYERYRKEQIEGSTFASWYTPWEDIQRPAITNIALSNPLMGAVKGGTIAALLSSPILGFANPMLGIGPLKSVSAGAIAGAALSAGRIGLGVPDNYIPDYARQQSEVYSYLDTLYYTKARALEELAISQGVDSSPYKKIARKTMIGANTPIMLRASLPTSSDKKYFDQFLNTPINQREDLVAGLSPHLAKVLNKAWNYDYSPQNVADDEAMAYLSDKEIPDYNSLVWNPMVDNKSMGFKVVEHGLEGLSDNYHKYGFYEGHESTIRTRMPDLWNEETSFTPPPNYRTRKQYFASIGQNIASSDPSSLFSTPYGARHTFRLQIDRSQETLDVVRNRY